MQHQAVAPTLDAELARKIDAYWRAANYLSVGQIYLCDNPLLKEPLALAHVKRMLLGHWGTTPGQNFIYTHLNRIIKEYDVNMVYMSGPDMGARPSWAVPISRVHTARSMPMSVRMRPD
jgi:xylulose-5-phosphate/fructose-6-phosphate phosphoketolase